VTKLVIYVRQRMSKIESMEPPPFRTYYMYNVHVAAKLRNSDFIFTVSSSIVAVVWTRTQKKWEQTKVSTSEDVRFSSNLLFSYLSFSFSI